MRKSVRVLAPLAAAALATAPLSAAHADHAEGSYQATLNEINNSGGSGMFSMEVNGKTATIDLNWSGLAETFQDGPYPHVQHVHIGNRGECPDMSADKNGDGVVSTPEGQPAYGGIGTTLSTEGGTGPSEGTNIQIAPGGGSTEYSRTFELNQDTQDALADGTGVVVVHGLDPADLSEQAANASSPLVPELPLAATAPALCGSLSGMPSGGVDTGAGTTDGVENAGMFALGGGLLFAGAGFYALRRRVPPKVEDAS
jgi:hypothetical protein